METVNETVLKKVLSLQRIDPAVPPIGHCQELEDTSAKRTGMAVSGKTRSDTAILTKKEFTVFFSSGRLYTVMIRRVFPTKLKKQIIDKTTILLTLTAKMAAQFSHDRFCWITDRLLKLVVMF